MAKNSIEVGINAPFDLGCFNSKESFEHQTELKKIYGAQNCLMLSDINNSNDYDIICISDKRRDYFTKPRFDEEDKIIYRVNKVKKEVLDKNGDIKEGEFYEIETGFHIGCIIVGDQKITINCGYSDSFLQRLIKFSNKLYINSTSKYEQSNGKYDLFNILEYLFLSSLKSVISLGVPKQYIIETDKNWNIKGNINWNRYFSNDLYSKTGVTYKYRYQAFDKDIAHVLSYAIKLCNKTYLNNSFKEITMFEKELSNYCPASKPSEKVLQNVLNSRLLSNGLYSKYKKVVSYAEMIIRHKNMIPDSSAGKKAVGWIIDITELWEDYLAAILKHSFKDWRIISQNPLHLYEGTFYERYHYPDIVMEKDGHIVIFDAKYKKMNFKNGDVDRADIHQVQSYYGYYAAQKKYIIDYVALVYPSLDNPKETKSTTSNMFGLSECDTKFGIAYVKIGNNELEQLQYENEFIERIQKSLVN